MASYLSGDEMMGAFLPGLFNAKLLKKNLAKIDPTSKTGLVGNIAQRLPLVGPIFGVAGAIGGGIRSASKTAGAAPSLAVPTIESLPGNSYTPDTKKKSDVIPLVLVGAAGIAVLATMYVLNK